jgi:hypothetical protein
MKGGRGVEPNKMKANRRGPLPKYIFSTYSGLTRDSLFPRGRKTSSKRTEKKLKSFQFL